MEACWRTSSNDPIMLFLLQPAAVAACREKHKFLHPCVIARLKRTGVMYRKPMRFFMDNTQQKSGYGTPREVGDVGRRGVNRRGTPCVQTRLHGFCMSHQRRRGQKFAIRTKIGLMAPDCRRFSGWRPTPSYLLVNSDYISHEVNVCDDCTGIIWECCENPKPVTRKLPGSTDRCIRCMDCSSVLTIGKGKYYPFDANWLLDTKCCHPRVYRSRSRSSNTMVSDGDDSVLSFDMGCQRGCCGLSEDMQMTFLLSTMLTAVLLGSEASTSTPRDEPEPEFEGEPPAYESIMEAVYEPVDRPPTPMPMDVAPTYRSVVIEDQVAVGIEPHFSEEEGEDCGIQSMMEDDWENHDKTDRTGPPCGCYNTAGEKYAYTCVVCQDIAIANEKLKEYCRTGHHGTQTDGIFADNILSGRLFEVPIRDGCCQPPERVLWTSLPWDCGIKHGHGKGRWALLLGNGSYSYTGAKLVGQPKPEWFRWFETGIRAALEVEGMWPDDSQWELALVNMYRNGANIPMHSDDEKEIDQRKPIISISIGAPVYFCYRRKKQGSKTNRVITAENAIVVMPPGFQKDFYHWTEGVSAGDPEWRINVTWRGYLPAALKSVATPVVATVAEPVRRSASEPIDSSSRVDQGDVKQRVLKNQVSEKHQPGGEAAGCQERERPQEAQASTSDATNIRNVPEVEEVPRISRYNVPVVLNQRDEDSVKPLLPANYINQLMNHLELAGMGLPVSGATTRFYVAKATEWFKKFDLAATGMEDSELLNKVVAHAVAEMHSKRITKHSDKIIEAAADNYTALQRMNLFLKESRFSIQMMPWWCGVALLGTLTGMAGYIVHTRLNFVDLIFEKVFARDRMAVYMLKGTPTVPRLLLGVIPGVGKRLDLLAISTPRESSVMGFLHIVGLENTVRRMCGAVWMGVPQVPQSIRNIQVGTAMIVAFAGGMEILSKLKAMDVSLNPPNSSAQSRRA